MPKILQMDPGLASLVAAGEVVERPASVVKELIENSVDAGATRITVEIRNGGITYIRVTDNGEGIAPEDVPTAFLRHATSKLKNAAGLESIGTLGFRGEALASIAAVAGMDLFTKVPGAVEGIHFSSLPTGEVNMTEEGMPNGTTMIVRDLFANVPARLKFLKKDHTEAANAEAVVTAAALSRPDIAFSFIKDSKQVFSTPGGGKLLPVIRTVLGGNADEMMPASGSRGNTEVSGYVSLPSFSRAGRGLQYFFVNGRVIRSRMLSKAVETAYKTRLMTGRSPVVFIYINTPVTEVDVNVHPAKTEVKFSRENEIFSAVYDAVSSALAEAEEKVFAPDIPVMPKMSAAAEAPEKAAAPKQTDYAPIVIERREGGFTHGKERADGRFAQNKNNTYLPHENIIETGTVLNPRPIPAADMLERIFGAEEKSVTKEAPPAEIKQEELFEVPEQMQNASEEDVVFRGEIFSTYIAVEQGRDLWLIDKHAAHERMVYNSIRDTDAGISQLLLIPFPVALTPAERAACMENEEELEKVGFSVRDLGAAGLVVTAAPAILEQDDYADVLSELAAQLRMGDIPAIERRDELLKSIACKAAVKGGQYSTPEEMAEFARRVIAMPGEKTCPHGRPIALRFSRYSIEKLFKRV